MKVGLFDHIEQVEGKAMATLFDERLEFAVAADEAGFYCLHLAEHHCTPLNTVPVPGVYMGALARLTKRMRFGPLVYLLPLYSPLRLCEEISMLDHMSRGRLEIGVGRGVSPFEMNYHKVDHDDSRNIFVDAYECLVKGLTNDELTHEGKYYQYKNVPMPMRPLQQPHPAFWYGSSNAIGATWAGEQGMHFGANGGTAHAKANIEAYKAALARRGGVAQPKAEFKGGGAIGILRHIVVADTDAEARRIMKPAMEHQLASLNWIRRRHGVTEFDQRHANIHRGADFEATEANGMAIAGSPATVLKKLEAQVAELGVNYLMAYMFFGDLTLSTALRSQHLFATEVMPKLEKL
jgi:alkanesulfonate monooxygenase SsuD/methylene tetrahydromethanopterin reductase-like flavin-dependent oxidoreductase (luciferase family)